MYELHVYYPGEPRPRLTERVRRAAEALDSISRLLAAHRGCERIVVMLSGLRLFSVDCAGNRLP